MTSKMNAKRLNPVFQDASRVTANDNDPAKKPSPFSIRLTPEERATLEARAGSQPLGAYIRSELLGENARKRRVQRKPQADEQKIAQLLAGLKSSRLAPNLNQLAKAANCGTLDVSEDVEQQLVYACQAIIAMRNTLIIALGLKPEGTGTKGE